MAKFQADMGKSAYLTEQSMLKMAASSTQAKQAIAALESQANKAAAAAISLGKGLLLGAAVGMSFDSFKGKIVGVIDSMANLKTVSEKTGSSVENLSALASAAKQSGSDLDAMAGALAKMSKGMTDADDKTKGAGRAFNYLGLEAKDAGSNLKDPAAMLAEVAVKLGNYQDGAGKAAIAQELFGESGVNLLPTLKLMAEQGDLVAKVTTEQATAARQYQRDLAKLDAQKGALFKTIATALLPTMSDLTNALVDASKNTNVLNSAAKDLAKDNGITDWADSAAMGVARVIDVIKIMPPLVTALSGSFKAVWADVELAGKASTLLNPAALASSVASGKNPYAEFKAQLTDRNKTLADANAAYDKLWNSEGNATEKAMQARIDARKIAGPATVKTGLKPLNFNSSGDDASAKGKNPDADYSAYLKNLQGQIGKVYELTTAEKLLADIRSGALTVSDVQQAKLMTIAQEIDSTKEAIRVSSERIALKRKDEQDSINAIRQIEAEKAQEVARRAADVEQIAVGLMNPVDQEERAYGLRMQTLQKFHDDKLENVREANATMEAETARHEQAKLELQASHDLQALSMASNSADQLYSLMEKAGMEQTALGKAVFLASKALAIAEIIINTEVAAAKATAMFPVYGSAIAMGIRVAGYASAGLVAGMAVAEASAEGGYDIPAGTNPVTQLHEREMVLPKQHADVIRGLAANGGAGGDMKLTIVNNTSAPIGQVTEQRISATERALIIQEAVGATAAQLSDPNSKTSRAFGRNYAAQRSR